MYFESIKSSYGLLLLEHIFYLCKDISVHVAGNHSYIFYSSCIFNLV